MKTKTILSVLSILIGFFVFQSCSKDVGEDGPHITNSGGVDELIDGEFFPIGTKEVVIPAGEESVTLTVFYYTDSFNQHLNEWDVKVEKEHEGMRVELLDSWSEEMEPYETISDGRYPVYEYRWCHHIRVSAEGESNTDRKFRFRITRQIGCDIYNSYFNVTKVAKAK